MLDVDFAVGAIPYFTSDVNANGIAAPFNFNFFPYYLAVLRPSNFYLALGRNNFSLYTLYAPLSSFNRKRKLPDLALQLSNKQQSTGPLDPWFVTGFADGQGCFIVSITKNKKLKITWEVRLIFGIGLKEKDFSLLEKIKKIFFSRWEDFLS